MWPWKKKDKKKDEGKRREEKREEEPREPDEHEIMLREMERELDRMMPGLGRMFREIERELERTMPEMLRMMEEMTREMRETPERQPVYRGIRIVIGPDGVPRIEQFGNVRRTADGRPRVAKYREPLVDVFDRGEEITVTAELPGVEKEDIEVSVDGKTLEILARGEGPFKYRKVVTLRDFIDPERSRAIFKNGILEITAKKSKSPAEGTIVIG